MLRRIFALALLVCSFASLVPGQDIDPRGIYFHSFTMEDSDGETVIISQQLVQITPSATPGDFDVRDIFGGTGGVFGMVDTKGNIQFNGLTYQGEFANPDQYTAEYIRLPSMGLTMTGNRVPTTTAEFPLILDSPRPAEPLLAGNWQATFRQFNPATGEVIGSGNQFLVFSTAGNTLTITDPATIFFTGVFEDGRTAGFRVLDNPATRPAEGIFSTFPGSAANIGRDLLGVINMISINEFRASFLLQTRTPVAEKTQVILEFTGTKIDPIGRGDADGNGAVDELDEAIVELLQGTTFEDDNYSLAADFNADGNIDAQDLAVFCLQGDANNDGVVDLLDVDPFVANILSGNFQCESDLNIDGVVDLLDVAPFVDILLNL